MLGQGRWRIRVKRQHGRRNPLGMPMPIRCNLLTVPGIAESPVIVTVIDIDRPCSDCRCAKHQQRIAFLPHCRCMGLLTWMRCDRNIQLDGMLRVGSVFLKNKGLTEIGLTAMRKLVEATDETANLAIPDGHQVVFVGQIETGKLIRAFFPPGTRTPMHASGTGKAILAALPARWLCNCCNRWGCWASPIIRRRNHSTLFLLTLTQRGARLVLRL